MADSVIRAEGIGKFYRLGARSEGYKVLRESITDAIKSPLRTLRGVLSPAGVDTAFWALRDVSFDVLRGDVMAVIGRNGAGKSTLLKILSRITEPTTGEVEIRGRIGSLLEVGSGFHPELSGRENVFMNGAMLGMSRAEIARKFDEIVAFAEVERFIDTPVKRYSSGMYMRLAFSVAAHLEPEILLVDEVLAVGDAAFQKKCLGKMGDVAHQGRTVLFVSHNMAAVQTLCTRALWLDRGEVVEAGTVGEVVRHYMRSATLTGSEQVWDNPREAPGNESVRLRRIAVRTDLPLSETSVITTATPIRIEIEYWNYKPGILLNASIELYSTDEVCVLSSFPEPQETPAGLHRAVCYVPASLLNDTTYRVRLFLVRDANTHLLCMDSVMFDVQDTERSVPYFGKWPGVVRPSLHWDIVSVRTDEHVCANNAE